MPLVEDIYHSICFALVLSRCWVIWYSSFIVNCTQIRCKGLIIERYRALSLSSWQEVVVHKCSCRWPWSAHPPAVTEPHHRHDIGKNARVVLLYISAISRLFLYTLPTWFFPCISPTHVSLLYAQLSSTGQNAICCVASACISLVKIFILSFSLATDHMKQFHASAQLFILVIYFSPSPSPSQ